MINPLNQNTMKKTYSLLLSIFIFLACNSPKTTTQNNTSSTSPNTNIATATTDANNNQVNEATNKNKVNKTGEAGATDSDNDMRNEENSMLAEINLMRSDPAAYVAKVENYLNDVKNDPTWTNADKKAELEEGRNLIVELSKTPKLSQLKPNNGLYKAAISHGKDLKKLSRITHVGSDGSQPFDRIKKHAATMLDGSENLVSGATDYLEGLMILLVDSNVPGKGHRKNLLNPKWESAACYLAGEVDGLSGTWVQLFGTESNKNNALEEEKPPLEEGPADYSFMSADEKAMIEEINLMRSNPKGYIPYIEAYVEEFKKAGWDALTTQDEVNTAKEVIAELKKLEPLSTLRPHQGLYDVATLHGKDLKQMGKIQHKGSDGSMPYNRVVNATELSDGNENIVGGATFVRESVITLLVDSGIPGRGHRKTLLEPKWDYVACYRIGQVGMFPNTWLQVFGAR